MSFEIQSVNYTVTTPKLATVVLLHIMYDKRASVKSNRNFNSLEFANLDCYFKTCMNNGGLIRNGGPEG